MIVPINSKLSFLQETCIRIQDSQYSVARNHSGLWTHSLTLTTSPHSMRTILVLIHPEELTYMYNMREDARLKKICDEENENRAHTVKSKNTKFWLPSMPKFQ